MSGLSKYKINKVRQNLNDTYDRAQLHHYVDGFNWYPKANVIAHEFSRTYGFDPRTVVGVLSALSPRNKWERNIADTATVLGAVNKSVDPDGVSVSTFHKNKYKAFRIAKGEDRITETSKKTFAFVQNIAYLDTDYITVDVWHHRASMQNMRPFNLTPYVYDQIQELTIDLAHQRRVKGFEFQAVVWNVVKFP